MAEPRRRSFTRLSVSRDPLFQGVWISPGDSLPTPTPTPPPPEPFQLVPEMPPAPPRDPEQEKKWQAAFEMADSVIAKLREKGADFDTSLLLDVVKDLIDGKFDVDDVVAVYRHRESKSHG